MLQEVEKIITKSDSLQRSFNKVLLLYCLRKSKEQLKK